ncbi:MAG: hypothetical protein R3E12_05495 [Candidatus Eisenbacteria bacterium]
MTVNARTGRRHRGLSDSHAGTYSVSFLDLTSATLSVADPTVATQLCDVVNAAFSPLPLRRLALQRDVGIA